MSTSLARHASEDVIINAPMSFAGAAQRAFRFVGRRIERRWVAWPLAALLTIVWWDAVLMWYLAFGLLLVPYRILRRGARKRKAEALRHREMMATLERERASS